MTQFTTERLIVSGVDMAAAHLQNYTLLEEVITLLTPAVVAPLPAYFQGINDIDAAKDWLVKITDDSELLLVRCRQSHQLLGLVFIHFDCQLAHIGYLIRQQNWRQGLASELLSELIIQMRTVENLTCLMAGVSADNRSSMHLLQKLGFVNITKDQGDSLHYQLTL
ncbi:GNAT family N-acetyltransferase [Shewanella waksmanii]|uniref:GNAT family N-acetyltransferase n=1 Tax=Shewanella waksmanii TaxID=213783 RepID=UPI003736B21C